MGFTLPDGTLLLSAGTLDLMTAARRSVAVRLPEGRAATSSRAGIPSRLVSVRGRTPGDCRPSHRDGVAPLAAPRPRRADLYFDRLRIASGSGSGGARHTRAAPLPTQRSAGARAGLRQPAIRMMFVSWVRELPRVVGPIRNKEGVASMRHADRTAVTTRILGGNNQRAYELEA